ncbi:MAG: hypothetical protein KH704_09820 [Clostridiales bacterium]|nr:hypothetical protein [Clostridiales bacterium]
MKYRKSLPIILVLVLLALLVGVLSYWDGQQQGEGTSGQTSAVCMTIPAV